MVCTKICFVQDKWAILFGPENGAHPHNSESTQRLF